MLTCARSTATHDRPLTGACQRHLLTPPPCAPSPLRRWEEYCRGDNPILEVAEGLLTGFVPALLIMLWQVRHGAVRLWQRAVRLQAGEEDHRRAAGAA